MKPDAAFGHQLRTRACGLLIESQKILLAKIYSPARNALIWMPPGGGVKPGETLKEATEREFYEETNLRVSIGNLLHINEFLELPFHAVEFYFEIPDFKGDIALGTDPELDKKDQLLKDLQWFAIQDIPDDMFSPQSLLPVINNWDDREPVPISGA